MLVRYDGVEYIVDVGEEPMTIGRAPGVGLSLTEPSVSWLHATLWAANGCVYVRDLDSTNGVTIAGVRLRGQAPIPVGATVKLGDRVELVALGGEPSTASPWVLEDLDRGRRFILARGETDLGALGVAEGVTLHVHASGVVTASMAGRSEALTVGRTVVLGAAQVRLVEGARTETLGQRAEPWPYRLTVRLSGAQGPLAELEDRVAGKRHQVTAENRVVLLYLLARRARDDSAAGKSESELGWCDEDELSIGIWGRGERSASALPVLVHRLRKELQQASFDADFLERGRRVLRARLIDILIQ